MINTQRLHAKRKQGSWITRLIASTNSKLGRPIEISMRPISNCRGWIQNCQGPIQNYWGPRFGVSKLLATGPKLLKHLILNLGFKFISCAPQSEMEPIRT